VKLTIVQRDGKRANSNGLPMLIHINKKIYEEFLLRLSPIVDF